MSQDPLAVMKVQLTVRNIGNVLNEFTDVMSFKTWVSANPDPAKQLGDKC
jgi:hypothetical protein